MGEGEILGHLSGPNGGIFAMGIGVGIFLTWMAFGRVLTPQMQRAHAAELSALQARIATLELEIRELVEFRDQYLRLLEAHSAATLKHPPGAP